MSQQLNVNLHGGQSSTEPDAAIAIAEHLARTRYEDLPASVVEAAKASILDTLGCILAGTPCEDVVSVRKVAAGWGGAPSSTLIGSGGQKLPPASAVLGNGAAIHQFDFDDTHDIAVMHPSSASLTPALALAEAQGGTSGKAIITAVALGNDISSRVGLATRGRMWDHPWFRAPVIGLFGATVSAAKIMNASADQHLNALGLTLPQVSGTWASLHHKGSSVRSIRDGLTYRNGVVAAELAMAGLRGDKEVFDGPYGFYHAFFRGDYDRNTLLHGLGEHYETERISLKPWPSIRHLHTALTAVNDLMRQHKLTFDSIRIVMLSLGQVSIDRCRPVALGSVPENHIDLAGNMHFAVAALIRHSTIPLAIYHETAMADEVITLAMPKVRWQYDAQFNGRTFEPCRVVITTASGQTHTASCDTALGHPDNPMPLEARINKFVDCAGAARHPLDKARAMQIVELVTRLEQLPDIRPLMALLA
jgi:2-methylcitrate dehydratase PrpD